MKTIEDVLGVPELAKCCFCGIAPEAEVEVRSDDNPMCKDNPMYKFSIEHQCHGIRQSHLSLFFQNDTPREKCVATLNGCVQLYGDLWNEAHTRLVEERDEARRKLESDDKAHFSEVSDSERRIK